MPISHPRRRRPFFPAVEALESRIAPAALIGTFIPHGSTLELHLEGSAAADVATIALIDNGATLQVTSPGSLATYPLANVTSLTIGTGDGDDTLTITDLPGGATTTSINLGLGNDFLSLNTSATHVSIVGGGGVDSLHVGRFTYDVTLNSPISTTLRGNFETIDVDAIANVDFEFPTGFTGQGTEVVTWLPDADHGSLNIFDAGTERHFTYPGSRVALDHVSSLTVLPPAGPDSVNVAHFSSGTGYLISRSDFGSTGIYYELIFNDIPSITLDLGANDRADAPQRDTATLVLPGIAGLQNFAVHTGAGDDRISYIGESANLANPGGQLTLDLGAGENDLANVIAFKSGLDVDFASKTPVTSFADGSHLTFTGAESLELSADSFTFHGGSRAAHWTPDSAVNGQGQLVFLSGSIGTVTYLTNGAADAQLAFDNFSWLALHTPAGADNLLLNGSTGQLTGSHLQAHLAAINWLTLDLGQADGIAGQPDSLSIVGLPAGLKKLSIDLGNGGDLLSLAGISDLSGVTIEPVAGSAFSNTLRYTGSGDMALHDIYLEAAGGRISTGCVFKVELIGSDTDQTFTVNKFIGAASIDGGGGHDTLIVDASNGSPDSLTLDATKLKLSDAQVTFTGLEAAELSGVNNFYIGDFPGSVKVSGDFVYGRLHVTTSATPVVTAGAGRVVTIQAGPTAINATSLANYEFDTAAPILHGQGTAAVTWIYDPYEARWYLHAAQGDSFIRLFTAQGEPSVRDIKSLTVETPAGPDVVDIAPAGVNGLGRLAIGAGANVRSLLFADVDSITADLGLNDSYREMPDSISINLNGVAGLHDFTVKTGLGDDRVTLLGESTGLSAGGQLTIDTGYSTQDTVVVLAHSAVDLSHGVLVPYVGFTSTVTYPDGSSATITEAEILEVTADSIRFVGGKGQAILWTPDATTAGGGTIFGAASGGFTNFPVNYSFWHAPATPATPQLTFENVSDLRLVSNAGADHLELGQSGHGFALMGLPATGPAYAVGLGAGLGSVSIDAAAKDLTPADDLVIISSLTGASFQALTISTGAGNDTLQVRSSVTSFALAPGFDGNALQFDAGSGEDTLDVTVADGLLIDGNLIAHPDCRWLSFGAVESVRLHAPTITYSAPSGSEVNWRPDAVTASSGTVSLRSSGIPVAYDGALTITGSFLTAETPAGADAFTLYPDGAYSILAGTVAGGTVQALRFLAASFTAEFGAADGTNTVADSLAITGPIVGANMFTLRTGAGDDSLTLSGLTRLPEFTFEPGAGSDTFAFTGDLSMVLKADSFALQGNLDFQDRGAVHFTSEPEHVQLTAGDSPNRFKFQFDHWTPSKMAAVVQGLGGDDLFDFTGEFTGTGSFQGGEGDDTFLLQDTVGQPFLLGAGAGAAFDGGHGHDSIVAHGDLNFTLTDSALQRTIPASGKLPARSLVNTLDSIEHATLTGGDHANLLNAGAFTGTSDLIGEGGIDNLIASKAGGRLYGFHAAPPTPGELTAKLYTRDNFFASAGSAAATDEIHATTKAGNLLSFRYYTAPTGINCTLPDAPGASPQIVSRGAAPTLTIDLSEGLLTSLEGSSFADKLKGSSKSTNILHGRGGADLLIAAGPDFLYGGAGLDALLGPTPYKFADTPYTFPNTNLLPLATLIAQQRQRG